MTTTFQWGVPEAIQTALSTGLNSFADGSTALSAAINNESDLYERINLELFLGIYDNHTTSSAAAYIWFLSTLDGTNYENGTAGTPGTVPQRSPDVVMPCLIQNNNVSVYEVSTNAVIPPLSFKIFMLSGLGGTMASSGNTLKYRRHNEQGV